MLASHLWLKEHLDDPNLVILDTRPKVAYLYGHIQNSISLTVEQVIKINQHGAHLVPDPEFCAELFGSIGIDETKTVVVVGESMDPSVARIAWTLDYLGHSDTKILDIGISMWQSLGFQMTRVQEKLSATKFVPRPRPEIRIESDDLKNSLGKITILDARSPQEFFGGHIPGSILSPFTDGLGQNGFVFDTKESLENLYAEKIPKDKEIVCYCMHGHRASSLFYQLKIAGYENVRLYDGSFIDWYSKRLPLE
ncbi:MAG: sulfurtransferase [Thaumarchaeota archaeon]|nr:sulfurtransferase [Nitrososphaerota archaeon]